VRLALLIFPVIFDRSDSHSSFYRFMFNSTNSADNVSYFTPWTVVLWLR